MLVPNIEYSDRNAPFSGAFTPNWQRQALSSVFAVLNETDFVSYFLLEQRQANKLSTLRI